ncbi:hypothetical protein DY000_02024804 [Brassica cretica]|uniref:SGS domain-containing protein n=1 Tax=Brassica cretica TaxID=69181 RepID=A0ABQ7EH05_BRACR|nr:hypothetical protein DY000_02024804 [Brassica cretica]
MTLFIEELIISFEKGTFESQRITAFLTQGLEKKTVNHLCCYNETNDNKSQRESVSSQIEIVGKEVLMRLAYPSSKKVKDYDKFEAEVKSIGTVLSIDWKDVGAKEIESTLHDDLELKTWKI